MEQSGKRGRLTRLGRTLMRRRLVFSALYLLLAAAVILPAQSLLRDTLMFEQQQLINERLALYEQTIYGELQRYRTIPYLVAQSGLIHDLLRYRTPVLQANRYLEEAVRHSEADVIYIMDADGLTLASSNWRAPDNFIGGNFSFRAYFRDAMAGREGGQFAVGTTSRSPGYYISRPIELGEEVAGVAVVKINLTGIERSWQAHDEPVLVADQAGLIVMASRDAWRYRWLPGAGGGVVPPALEIPGAHVDEPPQLSLETIETGDYEIAVIDGEQFLSGSSWIEPLGWQLFYLSSLAPLNQRLDISLLIMIAAAVTVYLLIALLHERREKLRSRREAADAAELRAINGMLHTEIEERRRAEQELRAAEAELVQATKMAALGQISASVAHEINQPLAAMRTELASARLLIARGSQEDVADVLQQVEGLVQRMTVMTRELKNFARKSDGRAEPFDLNDSINNALLLLRGELTRASIQVYKALPNAPVEVLGEQVRLEQVTVNLVRNAIDAMKATQRRELRICVREESACAILAVEDSGSGIACDPRQLFEPFFTTKDSGAGMGLGLAIAERIVTAMGGSIGAENLPSGGARFTVTIPRRTS
ncbi:ATP-binding protein [Alkalilimnicola ehrlichii]|uniref:sensor histidine kinase n=1 Tax=Alkalilimnicola ehrlichii TaxID=351052 RepID=UPI0015F24C03|nr:ATP-binding protein [Alkalilimnicola ehrlichii]